MTKTITSGPLRRRMIEDMVARSSGRPRSAATPACDVRCCPAEWSASIIAAPHRARDRRLYQRQIPIERVAPPVPEIPRPRALALLRRRPEPAAPPSCRRPRNLHNTCRISTCRRRRQHFRASDISSPPTRRRRSGMEHTRTQPASRGVVQEAGRQRCVEAGRRSTEGQRREKPSSPRHPQRCCRDGRSWSESRLARIATPHTSKRANDDDRQNDPKGLVERGSDDDLLTEMMAYAGNRMMDMEVESLQAERLRADRRWAGSGAFEPPQL